MRPPVLLTCALFLASSGLQRSAFADGNVTVFVDGAGDLWVVGDEQSNSLRIRDDSGVDGEFVLADDLGTTSVNGASSVTVRAPGNRILVSMAEGDDRVAFGGGGHVCCRRDVVFRGGDGDDVFRLEDESSILGNLDVDLGPGDDRFEAGEGSVFGALALLGGDGADSVRIGPYVCMGVSMGGEARIELGSGLNVLDARGESLRGPLTIVGGPDADTISIDGLDVAGFVSVTGGAGDDRLEIGAVRPLAPIPLDVLGPLFLDTGEGDDRITVRGPCELAPGLLVNTGNGQDALEFSAARVDGRCTVQLGTGDDRLRVEDSVLGLQPPPLVDPGADPGAALLFDGGAGADLYLEGMGNEFPSGPPALRGFDAPRLAEPPLLAIPTRVIGRIVLFHRPVPDATVTIAELGLTTSTDGAGSFRIDSPTTPPGKLELTAGATLEGRRACGSVQLRAAADSVVDVGELELRPGCANVMLFGDGQGEAAALEQILRSLGVAPTTIQRALFLPEDLSTFAAVWYVPESAPLTQAEEQRLAAFVRSGGGLHLAGEGVAIQAANEVLVNALVIGGGVRVGIPQGSAPWFPIVYVADAAGGVGRLPNPLANVMDFITGGQALGGVARPNVFIEGASGQVFAAVWAESSLAGGRGRLSLGLSTFWFRSASNSPAIENLHAFLARPWGLVRAR